MIILDGKKLALKKREILTQKIQAKIIEGFRKPKLNVILIGTNEASLVYVRNKIKIAQAVGIETEVFNLNPEISPSELYELIENFNLDDKVDGVLLQLPIPNKFNEEDYLQSINPDKDVDGFHYLNQGKMLQGYETVFPCTPLGVINLLHEYNIEIKHKNVVVIGTSNIVGKPLSIMLSNLGATVTMCNKNTNDISMYTKNADILISATGKQFIITKDLVKPNSVIVDIGIVRDKKTNKLVGDVDFENVAPIVDYITPVPGGVGPMTVITLMENTYKLYLKHLE